MLKTFRELLPILETALFAIDTVTHGKMEIFAVHAVGQEHLVMVIEQHDSLQLHGF